MKYEATYAHGPEHSVRKMCKILGLKESGYYPIVARKYRPTHNGKTDGKYCNNSLKRDFYTAKRNQVWSGDITYIRTKLGYVYLATVIDLYNREVIGYAISRDIDTKLVKAALGNADAKNGGKCESVIFHSDRGWQGISDNADRLLYNRQHVTTLLSL